MKNFLGFAKSYLIRKNPVKAFINDMIATFKDMLSINKKEACKIQIKLPNVQIKPNGKTYCSKQ